MRAMWPYVFNEFSSATKLVEAFYGAFPGEPDDEYPATFVVAELAKGGYDLPLG